VLQELDLRHLSGNNAARAARMLGGSPAPEPGCSHAGVAAGSASFCASKGAPVHLIRADQLDHHRKPAAGRGPEA